MATGRGWTEDTGTQHTGASHSDAIRISYSSRSKFESTSAPTQSSEVGVTVTQEIIDDREEPRYTDKVDAK